MIKTLKEFRNSHYFYVFGIDDMAIATVIGAVVAGVASIASSAATNKANKDAVESTNEQNRELTEISWQRDDAQLQRARQDAEKAGFSPLAALSSNLTNTSPATMQAPQYDFSGIGEGVGKIADAPRAAMASKMEKRLKEEQIAGAHEQARSLKLDNDLKDQTHDNNIVKSSMELMRLKKELDGMDLSNYEKASILVANGMKADLAKQIVGTDVNAHSGEVAAENKINAETDLAKAQTRLVNAQVTTENELRPFVKDLNMFNSYIAKSQAQMDADTHAYWFSILGPDTPPLTVPAITKDGKLTTSTIVCAHKTRQEVLDEYDRYMNNLNTELNQWNSTHNTPLEWTNAIWQNFNGTINAAASFFMPSTTTYQSYEYNRQGRVTGSVTQQTRSSGFGR